MDVSFRRINLRLYSLISFFMEVGSINNIYKTQQGTDTKTHKISGTVPEKVLHFLLWDHNPPRT